MDGRQEILPRNFAWEAGSTHTLGLLVLEGSEYNGAVQPSPQDGERLLFDGWSDGGDAAHDITVSGEPSTLTANFRKQVVLDTGSQGTIVVDPSGFR